MTNKLGDLFKRADVEIDPVCHMQVNVKNPPGGTAEREGKKYYFCGPGCRRVFIADPQKYLSGRGGGSMPHP
jgi:YHS domain-containing protein